MLELQMNIIFWVWNTRSKCPPRNSRDELPADYRHYCFSFALHYTL